MAESLWKPDGTQPLPPLDAWDDPTAGLVTGAIYDPEPPITVEVVAPVMPDLSEVRRAVDAVLSGEDGVGATVLPASRKPPRPQLPRELGADTPGMVAPTLRPGRPRIPVRQLSGLRARSKDEPPPPRLTSGRKPQSSGLAVGVLITLVVVVTVIAIVMISSLLETISSILN